MPRLRQSCPPYANTAYADSSQYSCGVGHSMTTPSTHCVPNSSGTQHSENRCRGSIS